MVLTSTLTDIGFVDAAVVALLGYAVVLSTIPQSNAADAT